MTFLPIVERELRVAVRRKATWRLRLWAVVLASALSALFLVFSYLPGAARGAGTSLFVLLLCYLAPLCFFAGVFLSADVLSGEKREGTLGLLFLTDLKGYDVVLGKFAGCAIPAFYCLFALMPVMALPLVLGGVTAGEFWRMMLALGNLLFFSLAIGVLVSSFCRDDRVAAGMTFCGLVLANGLSAAGLILVSAAGGSIGAGFCGLGPLAALFGAFEGQYSADARPYWWGLLGSHGLAWLGLAIASWYLPRSWQARPVERADSLRRRRPQAVDGKGFARRAPMLDRNPVFWLASGLGSARLLAWCCALVPVATIAVILWLAESTDLTMLYWFGGFGLGLLLWPLKLLIAFHACRFFVEARRSGALELLLSSPLPSREILQGQWLALRRDFLAPVVVVVLAMGLPPLMSVADRVLGVYQAAPDVPGDLWAELMVSVAGFGYLAYFLGSFLLKLAALGWLGMWLGLSSRHPSRAFAWTILWGLLVPMFAVCVPDLAVDGFLIFHASSRLRRDLRPMVFQHLHTLPSADGTRAG
jgi:ABC-type transport system involved in multi-copper enzyme maturation permease subunit